ncbi:transmembrane protein 168 isoform X8 [Ahaetulla prasina]|uniref:transmembrane protein 168 isoform X8 n=1 Tax=Ahaetulla prasina TaxID=499056 RepID=UPI00264832EA|nr:transmembrane protein 168 isoform X8 [Ahaetulla prasina]
MCLQPRPPRPPTPPPRRKCPITMPDKFSGQPEMFPTLGQCQLYMAMRPEDFPDDRAKVAFVINLLSGSAAQWATPLLLQDSPLLADQQRFWQHLRTMYEDPVRMLTATRRLKELCQGKRPLQEYIAEFHLLCQDSDWNDAALVDAFQEGLSEELQDELARVEAPRTLDNLVPLCLRLDARLQRRPSRRTPRDPPSTSAPPLPAPPAPRVAPRFVTAAEEPMELGAVRPRLTAQERIRRRQVGLCLYCGEPGHFAASCPRKRSGARTPVPESQRDLSGNGTGPTSGKP